MFHSIRVQQALTSFVSSFFVLFSNYLLTSKSMVNTFVTSANLKKCAKDLDYKRLGKQRVEAKQIIEAIEFGKSRWMKHPASKMWKDHLVPLKIYYNHMVREWVDRGYKNTLELYDVNEEEYSILKSVFDGTKTIILPAETEKTFPWWFAWEPFVNSHKASLVRKNPEFYSHFHCNDLNYYLDKGYMWPSALPESALDKFSEDFFAPLQQKGGSPVYKRYSTEDVARWRENLEINPKTGKKIKIEGPIYKELAAASRYYAKLSDAE